MNDLLKELLAAGVVPTTSFPPTSRYADIPLIAHDPGDGSPPVPHLARRFCPQPQRFATLYEVRIVEADRGDTLAGRHFGDPELWWRLADSNGVLDPRAVATPPGASIRITLALDIPESPDA
jgi:hypothetical protein